MPSTVEHKVEMHRLASERRKAGQPVWRYHVTIGHKFLDDNLPFAERRDALVADLKASKWYRRQEEREESELWQLIDELSDVEDEDTFDYTWDQIYDLADYERAWINAATSAS